MDALPETENGGGTPGELERRPNSPAPGLDRSGQTGLLAGSLRALVEERKLAVTLLLDYSGSMGQGTGSGQRKIDELRGVVAALPPVPMIGFSNTAKYLDGYIPEPQGGTNLAAALDLARANGVKHVGIISDGVPDDESKALRSAAAFAGQIDVFYVGPRGHHGEDFLRKLATASGGRYQGFDLGKPKELQSALKGLLGAGTPQLPERVIAL